MVDNSHDSTVRERTEIRETRSGGGGLAFIVGGLVVAVAVIAWFVFGGTQHLVESGTSSKPAASATVNVNGGGDTGGSTDSSSGGSTAKAGASSDGGATAGAVANSGN